MSPFQFSRSISDGINLADIRAELPALQPGLDGHSVSGPGVQGRSDNDAGVHGQGKVGVQADGTQNGVVANASDQAGTTYGVLGKAASPQGFGVAGYGQNGATAVFGYANDSGYGVHGLTNSGPAAVLGESVSSTAVKGISQKSPALVGESKEDSGVIGRSDSTVGVTGESNGLQGIGVAGTSQAGTGVKGESDSGAGVAGVSKDGKGVVGISANDYAGYFMGNVKVTGTLEKKAGSFKIDHPLDPDHKYLCHSFVESPDMMNVYNGNATLDANGEAWVELPDWFEALNKDFRYQLTAIGAPGPNLYIAREIQSCRFQIAGGAPRAKVSWQITGVRQDAYANAHRIQVELFKPEAERGLDYNQLPVAAD